MKTVIPPQRPDPLSAFKTEGSEKPEREMDHK